MTSRICALLAILIISVGFVDSTQAGDSPNLYRNRIHAFSLLFPTGWQQRSGQTPSTVVVSENREGDSIIIQVQQLPPTYLLDQFSDSDLQTS